MSFGRWLLIHSFSIFLVSLLLLGYLYREELQLEQVYSQILGNENQQGLAESPEVEPVVQEVPVNTNDSSEEGTAAAKGQVREQATEPSSPTQSSASDETVAYLKSTPTVTRTIIELDDLLFKARKAYWEKDYQTAIFHYQQLIQDDGDNPDHIGELGNIYYSINDFENAAEQYYQAAIILIARSRPEQARLLLSPVTAMNRELGEKLRQKLGYPH